MKELRIDPEFESIIPPLTEAEVNQLEENILAEGTILTAIIVWNDVIIDGHNRYKIAQKHPHIGFQTFDKQFEDRYEAIAWICKNQLGRRNLSEVQKRNLLGTRYNAEKRSKGAKDGFRGNQHTNLVNPQFADLPEKRTVDRIAKEFGVNHSTVERAGLFVEGLDAANEVEPGIKKQILSGIIKPSNQDVIAIGKAPEEDRPRLVEELRKPKPRKESPNHTPDPVIKEIDTISDSMEEDRTGVSEKEILVSLEGAVEMMIDTCGNYFSRYPSLLQEPYKAQVISIFDGAKQFISKIEGDIHND